MKEYDTEKFKEICKIANASSFLRGENDSGWKADFDFIIRVEKATAILEGKYKNRCCKSNVPEELEKLYEN